MLFRSSATLSVDLEWQCIRLAGGEEIAFDYDPVRRQSLLQGLDEIELTLKHEAKIAAFQMADRVKRPWIYGPF